MTEHGQGARPSGVLWLFGFGGPTLNLLCLFSAQYSRLGTAGESLSPWTNCTVEGGGFGRLER